MTGIGWLDTVLALVGPVVVIASIVASGVNAMIRTAQEKGKKVAAWILTAASALNFAATNLDKAMQLITGGRGPSTPPVR